MHCWRPLDPVIGIQSAGPPQERYPAISVAPRMVSVPARAHPRFGRQSDLQRPNFRVARDPTGALDLWAETSVNAGRRAGIFQETLTARSTQRYSGAEPA